MGLEGWVSGRLLDGGVRRGVRKMVMITRRMALMRPIVAWVGFVGNESVRKVDASMQDGCSFLLLWVMACGLPASTGVAPGQTGYI